MPYLFLELILLFSPILLQDKFMSKTLEIIVACHHLTIADLVAEAVCRFSLQSFCKIYQFISTLAYLALFIQDSCKLSQSPKTKIHGFFLSFLAETITINTHLISQNYTAQNCLFLNSLTPKLQRIHECFAFFPETSILLSDRDHVHSLMVQCQHLKRLPDIWAKKLQPCLDFLLQ